MKYICYISLLLCLLNVGCKEEFIQTPNPSTGKTVIVDLKLKVARPAASVLKATDSKIKGLTSDWNHGLSLPFSVTMENEPEPETRSDGSTKLYRLWIFQFDEAGNIVRAPTKISDEVEATNDMVTLEVPLTVAENQTIYLIALGKQIDYDFLNLSSLKELETTQLKYIDTKNGEMMSLIQSDEDIPFAGKAVGVNVMSIENGNRGLVEYNKPEGFSGGIDINRLMAKVSLKYQFDVPNYTVEGVKLKNVASYISLESRTNNPSTDTYYDLDVKLSEDPVGGYYTATWYVAENKQGTVDDILTESDRYYISGTTPSGKAPALGTNLEVWAYVTANPNNYSIYQIYVGNNNTSNFDVEKNNAYNLTTTINTDISSATNDKRVTAFTATQQVYFAASAKTGSYSPGGSGYMYDFDCHYNTRPIIIDAKGRTISVEIFTDADCTQPADLNSTWLRLSASPNYTDAYNSQEPLSTKIATTIKVPAQLKFYLYCDEYIDKVDTEGLAADDNTLKRTLYVKVHTKDLISAASTTNVFTMRQRAIIYAGSYGGERNPDGSYQMGLGIDDINESGYQYTPEKIATSTSLYSGYNSTTFSKTDNIYDTYNVDHGRLATRKLAENDKGLAVNTGLTTYFDNPRKRADGKVELYQYAYHNVYGARFCYDRNRDENGNGVIDDNELKWYLPSYNQCAGIILLSDFKNRINGGGYILSTAIDDSPFIYFSASYLGISKLSGRVSIRCVRDIPIINL